MHISEGVLSGPVLLAGGAVAAACVGVGLARMREEDIVTHRAPRAAIMRPIQSFLIGR